MKQALNCTLCGVAALLHANGLTLDPVFWLVNVRPKWSVVARVAMLSVTVLDVFLAVEGGVAEMEGCGVVVLSCVVVLSRVHEEVEVNPDDISNVLSAGVSSDVVVEDVVQDGRGEGFDLRWKRIILSVAA